jgi:glutaredoxin
MTPPRTAPGLLARLLGRLRLALNRSEEPPMSRLHFVVYTRRGCHLCDEAWAQLDAARAVHGFALSAVDVDQDPALQEEHGLCVPVVAVNGKVRFRGRVNPVLLARLLEAERQRSQTT